jgi:hypothetical protein
VLHRVGSAVRDFLCDLSRLYARDCLSATADPDRYEAVIAYVMTDRRWRFPAQLEREAIATARSVSLAGAISHIRSLHVDVMVPQMFCLPGMIEYRALFDLLGIPYLGNPPDVRALGSHKGRAKAVVAAAGVLVPCGDVVGAGEMPSVAPPAVVKPVDGDNSLGVTLVRAFAIAAGSRRRSRVPARTGRRRSWRATSSSAARSAAGSSSATASSSTFPWRSTPSIVVTGRSAWPPTRSDAGTTVSWRSWPRSAPRQGMDRRRG